ncbi:Autophagy protein 7 [Ascosphaera atra]|nr:Autophagy protein 7 [Ascosphaera atra]
MDTRESRWLPTIMGKASGKVVMNAALGFDTFVIMRHGATKQAETDPELVTRPGIAAIASAMLVELFVSVLQHPQGQRARSSTTPESEADSGQTEEHPLGLVPHQIRGFLANFNNILVTGKSYNCCSACSDAVVNTYREQGWQFVQRALNERGYIEELSGLKEVQRKAEEAAAALAQEEDELGGYSDEEII